MVAKKMKKWVEEDMNKLTTERIEIKQENTIKMFTTTGFQIKITFISRMYLTITYLKSHILHTVRHKALYFIQGRRKARANRAPARGANI